MRFSLIFQSSQAAPKWVVHYAVARHDAAGCLCFEQPCAGGAAKMLGARRATDCLKLGLSWGLSLTALLAKTHLQD